MEQSSSKMMWVALALIIGIIVGGGVGYAGGMSKQKTSDDTAMKIEPTSAPSPMAASDGITVGGAKMVRNLDIVDNAVNASNVTTVVSLVKLAGLVDTLKSVGPFTVFAPNNDAFGKLPAATVTALQQPANKAQLADILTYHVVAGTYTTADLKAMAAKGQALTTVEGGMLMPVMANNTLQIKDAAGNSVSIETADVISSNGVTHVIDSVLMPT
jgi:uncharacterized surface protein with fasciclin (FAS1) repeats